MRKSRAIKKLRVQIALHSFLASVLIFFLIGSILYYSISSLVQSESVSTTKTAVNKSGMYIEMYIERLKAVSSLLAENPQLVDYFSSTERDDATRQKLLTTIDTTIASDPYIQSVIMVSKNGRILSNERNLTMSMSGDMMKEAWYQSAINSGNMPVLTSARMQQFSMDKDNWVISISREIKNQQDENIGVLLNDIKYKVIEDYLTNGELGDRGFSFILNDDGEVVYHADTSYFRDPRKQQELQQIVANKNQYDAAEHTLT